MPEVEYRIVAGWPAYRVGGDGSVWSRWENHGRNGCCFGEWKLLNPDTDDDGYRRISLCHDGLHRTRKVSVLVCEAFHGRAPKGLVCRHKNGICTDDRADNLAWGTQLENVADKRTHGTMSVGERHGLAKLTDAQIAELRSLKGTMFQREAAVKFGVSRGYVGQLWSGSRNRGAA